MAQSISGEYLARHYEAVKGRPLFVVQSLHGLDEADPFALQLGIGFKPREATSQRQTQTPSP